MNTVLLLIILVPLIEIYLLIKIGSQIGALSTISLILFTAFVGIFYVRYEGFNTLKSAIRQLVKNEIPVYEIISGAALAFAALLLIIPGFMTDIVGFLLIIPITRKFFINSISSKFKYRKRNEDIIEGSIEEEKDEKNEDKN